MGLAENEEEAKGVKTHLALCALVLRNAIDDDAPVAATTAIPIFPRLTVTLQSEVSNVLNKHDLATLGGTQKLIRAIHWVFRCGLDLIVSWAGLSSVGYLSNLNWA